MTLIFGSTALKHWFPDFKREPKDLDIMSGVPMMTKEVQHYWYHAFNYIAIANRDPKYVEPNYLYTIKVSHAAWDIFWDKTMHDIMFMKSKGCKLDKALYYLLYAEWEVVHRQKRINLNVKNEEFFTKTVTRKFGHDWLHNYLAFGSEPMHNQIRPDPSKAYCSEKLWTQLSPEDKLKTAMEEIYVIATERYVVPLKMPPRIAKIKATKNLITSMTKGWFNLFLIENFDEIIKFDNTHFVNKLKDLPNG